MKTLQITLYAKEQRAMIKLQGLSGEELRRSEAI